MGDSDMEDIGSNWVIVSDTIDIGEEAFENDGAEKKLGAEMEALKNKEKSSENSETDSIGVLSETSSFQECGENEEELIYHNEMIPWRFCEYVGLNNSELDEKVSSSNQFYLNCLHEPVQELSENESDVDRDACIYCTDPDQILEQSYGSSIEQIQIKHEMNSCSSQREKFSENCDSCDQPVSSKQSSLENQAQDLLVIKKEGNDLLHNTEIEHEHVDDNEERFMDIANRTRDLTEQDRPCNLIRKYTNGILVGTVLLALSSMFLGHYLKASESMEEDLPMYKEDFKEDLKETLEALPAIQESYDVPTALTYCSDKHQSDDIYKELNIKKCLNKIDRRIQRAKEKEKLLSKEMYLEAKEKFLEQRERNLLKREYEVLQSELNLEHKRSLKQKKVKEEHVYSDYNEKTKNKNRRGSEERNDKDKNIFKENRNDINKKSDKPSKHYNSRFEEHKENGKYKEKKKMYKSKNSNDLEEKGKQKDNAKKLMNTVKYNENKYSKNESKTVETRYRNNYNKNEKQYKFERTRKLNENNYKFGKKKAKMAFEDVGKWYFDWMKGREVLRYIERYSRV